MKPYLLGVEDVKRPRRPRETFKKSLHHILFPEFIEIYVAGNIMSHLKNLVKDTGAAGVDVDGAINGALASIANVLQATDVTSLDAAAAAITPLEEKLGVATLEEGKYKIDSLLQVADSTTIAGAARKITSPKIKESTLQAELELDEIKMSSNKSVDNKSAAPPFFVAAQSPPMDRDAEKILNGTDEEVGIGGVGLQRQTMPAAPAADNVSQLNRAIKPNRNVVEGEIFSCCFARGG